MLPLILAQVFGLASIPELVWKAGHSVVTEHAGSCVYCLWRPQVVQSVTTWTTRFPRGMLNAVIRRGCVSCGKWKQQMFATWMPKNKAAGDKVLLSF